MIHWPINEIEESIMFIVALFSKKIKRKKMFNKLEGPLNSRYDFIDAKRADCSIQEDWVEDGHIRLGRQINRMLLNREQAAELAGILSHFAETGTLEGYFDE